MIVVVVGHGKQLYDLTPLDAGRPFMSMASKIIYVIAKPKLLLSMGSLTNSAPYLAVCTIDFDTSFSMPLLYSFSTNREHLEANNIILLFFMEPWRTCMHACSLTNLIM